jgi:hypothetical protein
MRRTRIVTHNGSAHRDEFLACCVALCHEFTYHLVRPLIERRLALPADLACPKTYVIDTGGCWNPELLNFDHHQPDSRLTEKCALDLVLEHVMDPETLRGFSKTNDWLRLTTVQDTRGSSEAALFVGVTPRSYAIMRSPVEMHMLKWFSESSQIHPDSALYASMLEIGRGILSSVPDIKAQQQALHSIPGPVDLGGVLLWDIRPAWNSDDRNSFAVVNEIASNLGVDVVVGHNLRHNKVGLYRQEWAAKKLDLSRIAEHPKHHSSHQNGFYAVVSEDVKDFELVEMIEMAKLPTLDR